MSDFYFVTSIAVIALGIVLIVAQLRLFSIDKTLKAILSQIRSDKKSYDFDLKMLLFELRGDKAAAEQLEEDRKQLSDEARAEAIKRIKPEVLERLRQQGHLPKQ